MNPGRPIDDPQDAEMPTPCADCRRIFELNDLYSMVDGSVICGDCKWVAEEI